MDIDQAVAGAQLRQAREAAGLSLTAMAARVPYSRSALSYFETGERTHPADIGAWYQRVCGTLADPITSLVALGRADVDRRSFLRKVAYSAALSATALAAAEVEEGLERLAQLTSSSRVGMAEVRAVHKIADGFHELDEAMGGGTGRTAVAEFLATDVATMLQGRFADPHARREAYSAAAELAYLVGFKSHDADLDGVAQRYYLAARRLAQYGLPGHEGFATRILALQNVDVGKPGEVSFSVPLAEEALRLARGAVSGDAEAVFRVALVRCYAEQGHKREALAALRELEAGPWAGTEVTTELPRYVSVWMPNKATIANQTAKAFVALQDTPNAEHYFRKAASIWNPDTHRRVYSIAVADTGMGMWQTGDQGGAVDVWRGIVPTLAAVDSVRTDKALNRIRAVVPDVVEAALTA
ncbi:helix-turn-helix domain-containing protein [Nocardia vulneris]|uniref:helix-turn-helix domain-containing protein n=1 Tax=Nocardia vulneris TaxID=1141657 RepID=UPI00068C2D2D|nr:transcriptional regulator [Nocardia vulneris]